MRSCGSNRLGPGARRAVAAALALQYAVLFAALPLAHAALAGAERPVAAHVETQGNDSCPPSHDHTHCLAFQSPRFTPATVQDRLLSGFEPVVVRASAADAQCALPSLTFQPLGSRAPPLA